MALGDRLSQLPSSRSIFWFHSRGLSSTFYTFLTLKFDQQCWGGLPNNSLWGRILELNCWGVQQFCSSSTYRLVLKTNDPPLAGNHNQIDSWAIAQEGKGKTTILGVTFGQKLSLRGVSPKTQQSSLKTELTLMCMRKGLTRSASGGHSVGIGKQERLGGSKQSALFAADQPTSWPYMSHSWTFGQAHI